MLEVCLQTLFVHRDAFNHTDPNAKYACETSETTFEETVRQKRTRYDGMKNATRWHLGHKPTSSKDENATFVTGIEAFLPPALLSYVLAHYLGSGHPSLHAGLYTVLQLYYHDATDVRDYLWLLLVLVTAQFVPRLSAWYLDGSFRHQIVVDPTTAAAARSHFHHDEQPHRQGGTISIFRRCELVEPGGSASSNLKPLLFPSRTTHRRLFPTPHSFSYSYLLVGVAVNSSPQRECSNLMLSTDLLFSSWFAVPSSSYLQRGIPFTSLSLRQKLDLYLREQNLDPTALPHAYLVTAPQFLGFSFNPVSFWYLYTAAGTLDAMILEVNNTFDERRMYFLRRSSTGDQSTKATFDATWQKDFHVSPFNDRSGSYSVTALDVAATGCVDVTIVLRDEDEKAKLVARMFSAGTGIDPVFMTTWQRICFLIQYAWIGFLTNPRILREARLLWVKKLKVFYRPEPESTTIGRHETQSEIVLEDYFKRVLQMLSQRSGVGVEYTPAAGTQRGKTLMLGRCSDLPQQTTIPGARVREDSLQVQVLTPSFYSELGRTTDDLMDVFQRFCFSPKRGEALVWISSAKKIRELLQAYELPPSTAALAEVLPRKWLWEIVTLLVATLRSVQHASLWATTGNIVKCGTSDIIWSQFDLLVWHALLESSLEFPGGESRFRESYMRSTTTILLADHFALGFESLVKLEFRLLRAVIVVALTGVTLSLAKLLIPISAVDRAMNVNS